MFRNESKTLFTPTMIKIKAPRNSENEPEWERMLEVYEGHPKQDLLKWVSAFEATATMCAWNSTQKATFATRLLGGDALNVIIQQAQRLQTQNLQLTIESIIQTLKKEFLADNYSLEKLSELLTIKQGKNETVQSFQARAQELAMCVNHGCLSLEGGVSPLVTALSFRNGLRPELKERVMALGASEAGMIYQDAKSAETAIGALRRESNFNGGAQKSDRRDSKSNKYHNQKFQKNLTAKPSNYTTVKAVMIKSIKICLQKKNEA